MSAVARFMAGSLIAIAVVVVGAFFVLRPIAVSEAESDTRERVVLEGRLVESAGLGDGVLSGDRRALAHLDALVVGQLLTDSVVRVKLWSRDGRILYSDEPRIIGHRFELGAGEQRLFDEGGADAELSDLSEPENRFERSEGELLEAHTVIRTPNGTPVLFESYQRFASINADVARLLGALAPPLLIGLAVLLALQAPLVLATAHRLQRAHTEREELLKTAMEASEAERRRIASDLHDGVVQDVAGVAFGLAPLAAGAARRGDHAEAAALHEAGERLRQGVRSLRTLLVEIHPANLESVGLEAAISDLLSPLRARGIEASLAVDGTSPPGAGHDHLIYRVTREALRNVAEHAEASSVAVTLSLRGARSSVEVVDDGRGFSARDRELREDDGHVGLRLLEGLVRQSGGTLSVVSAAGTGTRVSLVVGR